MASVLYIVPVEKHEAVAVPPRGAGLNPSVHACAVFLRAESRFLGTNSPVYKKLKLRESVEFKN